MALFAVLSIIAAGLGLVPFIVIHLIALRIFEEGISNADTTYVFAFPHTCNSN
jgi:hypothetical protein